MILKAEKRDQTGRQVKIMRESGKLPAVVYGHGFDNQTIVLNLVDFSKVLDEAGESTLVDLKISSSEPYKVIIQEVQRDPVSNQIIHADLRRVKMDEKIEADIPLSFVGIAPAVKELGGIMVTPLDSINVKALPQDLIHELEVDIAGLKTFDDVLRVKDLNIPDKFEVLNQMEAAVVLIEEPRAEEIPAEKPEDEIPEGAEEEVEGDEKEGDKKDDKRDEKKEDKPEGEEKKEN